MAVQPVNKEQALAALKAYQDKSRGVSVIKTVKDMKATKFLNENWSELLLAAPNCLQLLATCEAVGASSAAGGIEISKPVNKPFDYLKYDTLKGCLAQVSNQGQNSFQIADTNMASIYSRCEDVQRFVDRIVKALASMDAPIQSLVGHMGDLKEASKSCHESATAVHKTFDDWQQIAQELYGACNNESAKVEIKQRELQAKLTETIFTKGENDKLVEKYDTAVKEMNDQVKEFKDEYKKQLDEFPGAWTLLAQSSVMALTQGVTTIGAAAVNRMANPFPSNNTTLIISGDRFGQGPANNQQSAAPAAPATPGALVVKDAQKAEEAGKDKEEKLSSLRGLFKAKVASQKMISKSAAQDSTTATSPVSSEPGSNPKTGETAQTSGVNSTAEVKTTDTNVKKTDAGIKKAQESQIEQWPPCDGKLMNNDPAMIIIDAVATQVEALRSIIIDAADVPNVQWDRVSAKPGDAAQPSSATAIKAQLDRKKAAFKPEKKGLASQLMIRILDGSIAVADELLQEAKKGNQVAAWVKPDSNSPVVADWDKRITTCSDAATSLRQQANAAPGALPGGVGSLFAPKSDVQVQAETNERSNLLSETVKSATTKLTSAQEVYKATLNTYKEMKDKSVAMHQELVAAQGTIKRLELEKVNQQNVREVLVKCIGFLAELKLKIGKLVTFFSGVDTFVTSLIKGQVDPFQREVDIMIKSGDIKQMRYNAYLRDIIFQLTLQIYSQFELFKDITSMYREVHKQCILEGLKLAADCAIPSIKPWEDMTTAERADYDKQILAKKKAVDDYAKAAAEKVLTIVQSKQDEIIKGIERRVTDIGAQIESFPAELQPSEAKKELLQEMKAITESNQQEQIYSEPTNLNMMTSTLVEEEEEE